ncbi:MAG: hypothetical protein GC179_16345 [Anaerolineaceae bacterium]|nr:hypothetical protein [Anaerolineaceae bacterium]
MARKRRFIISRNTWRLHQFEFSVACSYANCLDHMKRLEIELQRTYQLGLEKNPRSSNYGSEPYLRFGDLDDTAASFELFWNNIVVNGTAQSLTEESTLFVGLSQFSEDFPEPRRLSIFRIPFILFLIGIGAVAVLVIFSALSAYVLGNPSSRFNDLYIDGKAVILGFIILALATIYFYLRLRWEIERAVKLLMDAFNDCST